MLGAIIGDIVGSRFEFQEFKSKEFEFLVDSCKPTDDTFMTLAVAKTLCACVYDDEAIKFVIIRFMQELGKAHPNTLWGERFYKWLFKDQYPAPYNSYGNGAAMRISPVGWVAKDEDHVKKLSYIITSISHNHPEGLKGAEAIAMAVYLARIGESKDNIKKRMIEYYPILGQENFSLDNIRPNYGIDEMGNFVSCQGSVPQALEAFFESNDFEDSIRNAISLGGDSDTLACMTGAVAEAYYGISESLQNKILKFLDNDLIEIVIDFNKIKKLRTKTK